MSADSKSEVVKAFKVLWSFSFKENYYDHLQALYQQHAFSFDLNHLQVLHCYLHAMPGELQNIFLLAMISTLFPKSFYVPMFTRLKSRMYVIS